MEMDVESRANSRGGEGGGGAEERFAKTVDICPA